MKVRIIIALIALFMFVSQAHADLIVIGDVDAPNTLSRPQNYDLLENVRNGGTDIVWLTGGSPVNSRYTDLRARWTTAGATITDDLTTSVGTSLSGRDLVVISQLFATDSLFDAAAISALDSYIAGGGQALYIAQTSGASTIASYNAFLSGIGSSMQFLTNGSGGTEIIDTTTPYGVGVTAFVLNGWTTISGGVPVVTQNGETGVAFETSAAPPTATPVPTVSIWGLGILVSALGLIGLRRRTSNSKPI